MVAVRASSSSLPAFAWALLPSLLFLAGALSVSLWTQHGLEGRGEASNLPPFFPPEAVEALNNASRPEAYGKEGLGHSGERLNRRVVWLLVDGLRLDAWTEHAALHDVWQGVKRDARAYRVQSEIPSSAVPNVVAMITGSPPELSGFMGNHRCCGFAEATPEPSPYETVFSVAGEYGRTHSFLSDDSTGGGAHTASIFLSEAIGHMPLFRPARAAALIEVAGGEESGGESIDDDTVEVPSGTPVPVRPSPPAPPSPPPAETVMHEKGDETSSSSSSSGAPMSVADAAASAVLSTLQGGESSLPDPPGDGPEPLPEDAPSDDIRLQAPAAPEAAPDALEWASDTAGRVLTGADLSVYYHSALDREGHRGSVRRASYAAEVRRVAAMLRAVLASADENTVVVVSSAHGTLDGGGHGGVERHARDTMLLMYRRGSALGTAAGAAFGLADIRRAPSAARARDLAPTMAALLGVPVPRENDGLFVDDALPFGGLTPDEMALAYANLAFQQSRFLAAFKRQVSQVTPRWARWRAGDAEGKEFSASVAASVAGVRRLDAARREAEAEDRARQMCVVGGVAFSLLLVLLYALARVVSRSLARAGPGGSQAALVMALAAVALYHVLAVLLFLLAFAGVASVDDEFVWNSSEVDSSTGYPAWVLWVFCVPLLIALDAFERHVVLRDAFSRVLFRGRAADWDGCRWVRHTQAQPRRYWLAMVAWRVYLLQAATSAALLVLALLWTGEAHAGGSFAPRYVSRGSWIWRAVFENILVMGTPLLVYAGARCAWLVAEVPVRDWYLDEEGAGSGGGREGEGDEQQHGPDDVPGEKDSLLGRGMQSFL